MAAAKKKKAKKGKMPTALKKYWAEKRAENAPAKKARKAKKAPKGKAKKLSGGTVTERLYGLEKRVQGLEVSEAQNYRLLGGMLNAWRKSKGLKTFESGKIPGMRVPRLYSSRAAMGVKVSKLFGSGT